MAQRCTFGDAVHRFICHIDLLTKLWRRSVACEILGEYHSVTEPHVGRVPMKRSKIGEAVFHPPVRRHDVVFEVEFRSSSALGT